MAGISANNILKCIFANEKVLILLDISLKFVPSGLIDNRAALVRVTFSHKLNQC